ncbi:hypothetical protein HID58_006508, partial [Brassica napus]
IARPGGDAALLGFDSQIFCGEKIYCQNSP